MKQTRKSYDTLFKRQAVELTKERKNKSELARELGIPVALLYKWCKEFEDFGTGSFPGNGKLKLTSEQERIRDLEKKLADVELEHEIKSEIEQYFSEIFETTHPSTKEIPRVTEKISYEQTP